MIKHITLGTNEVFFFNYKGEELPLRPISSFELDDCFYKSLRYADEEISELVVKLKLSIINVKDKIDIDNKKYAELKKYFDSLDYWIVYHGMKDFQDFDFSKPDSTGFPSGLKVVQQMQHVHEIATEILTYSYQPKEVIEEIIRDEEGKLVASVVFNLNVPLAELSKITKLQRDFLILSKIGKIQPRKKISKTGDKMDIRDILGGLVNGSTNR